MSEALNINDELAKNRELLKAQRAERARNTDPEQVRASHHSLAELIEALKMEGIAWHESNTDTTRKHMHVNRCTELLMLHAYIVTIGDEPDKALLGVYNPDTGLYGVSNTTINRLIRAMNPDYKKQDRTEVIYNLRLDAELVNGDNDKNLIPLANGIYDMKQKKLLPFSPEYIFTSKIVTAYPVNGVSEKTEALVDEFLSNYRPEDEAFKLLLLQIGQDAMNSNQTHKKMIFLKGYEGNNGKSTFEELLINTIGEKHIASLEPSAFSERFATYSLIGKVANIADDVDGNYIAKNGVLKSATTGNAVNAEKKQGNRFTVHFKAALIFSCNNLPTFKDKSGGMERRLLIVPFTRSFPKGASPFDEEFTNCEAVKQCFLKKCLDIGAFEQFIEPDYVRQEVEDFLIENDYVKRYVIEEFINQGYHLMKDKAGNSIPVDKIPANLVKHKLKLYKEEDGDNTRVGRGYAKRFIRTLKQETGCEYKYTDIRINSENKRYYPQGYAHWIEAEKDKMKGFKIQNSPHMYP
ncbi:MAG: phage/plasmid primase, P4 family [Aerococcus sp.]|nr:phage/plasmid primase, P4 family [Aerococcus sp.]